MSLNKVMLIGNVGKDPEVRYLDKTSQNGESTKVAQFTLATTERYRDRSGEMRENTEWHNIVAWRNSADIAEKYIRKGTQIYVEGKLRTRMWTDQSGVKHYTTEIIVDNLQLLGKKSDNPAAQEGSQTPQPAQYQRPAAPVQTASPAPKPQQPAVPAKQDQAEPMDISLGDMPQDDLPF